MILNRTLKGFIRLLILSAVVSAAVICVSASASALSPASAEDIYGGLLTGSGNDAGSLLPSVPAKNFSGQDTGNSPALFASDPDDMTITDKLKQNFVEKRRYQYIIDGLKTTITVTVFAVILGLIIGAFVAVIRTVHELTGKLTIADYICSVYLTIIRGTPTMIQLLIIYYVIFGSVDVNKILVAIVAFGINSGAYIAEIMRSGINAVPKGQFEAGLSLGLPIRQTMTSVILPQAFRNMLPALCNEFISLMKETAICGYIGLMDLTKAADIIRSQTFEAFMPLFGAALIYLIIVMILAKCVGKLERRLKANETR